MGRIGLIGTYPLLNVEETLAFGKKVGESLSSNSVLALTGDLGAGKTTFVQGLAVGLGIEDPIQSPTFVLLNIYDGRLPLFHFDLYRLKGAADFLSLGFEEYFQSGGISAIEWPDRITPLLPVGTLHIDFNYVEDHRVAVVKIV